MTYQTVTNRIDFVVGGSCETNDQKMKTAVPTPPSSQPSLLPILTSSNPQRGQTSTVLLLEIYISISNNSI